MVVVSSQWAILQQTNRLPVFCWHTSIRRFFEKIKNSMQKWSFGIVFALIPTESTMETSVEKYMNRDVIFEKWPIHCNSYYLTTDHLQQNSIYEPLENEHRSGSPDLPSAEFLSTDGKWRCNIMIFLPLLVFEAREYVLHQLESMARNGSHSNPTFWGIFDFFGAYPFLSP